jgi:hypothetical protein
MSAIAYLGLELMAAAGKSVEVSGVRTLTGTPDEVRAALSRLHAEQVIALTTLEHGNEAAASGRFYAKRAAQCCPPRDPHQALRTVRCP